MRKSLFLFFILFGNLATSFSQEDGVLWKIAGNSARVKFISKDAEPMALPSNRISANFKIPNSGEILLAERFSSGWRLLVDGQFVKPEITAEGLTKFKVETPGDALLIHDGTLRRGALSLQFIAWVVLIILTLPAGRRKREISEMELS